MKRADYMPLIALVLSLGFTGCETHRGDQSKTDGRESGFTNARRELVQTSKEEWSKGKELGRRVGSRLDDEWIHGMIIAKLIANSTTLERNIDVDVDRQVVTLRGAVVSAAQKNEAERIARQTRGVKQVNNLLGVSA